LATSGHNRWPSPGKNYWPLTDEAAGLRCAVANPFAPSVLPVNLRNGQMEDFIAGISASRVRAALASTGISI